VPLRAAALRSVVAEGRQAVRSRRHETLTAATFRSPRPTEERPDRRTADKPLAPRGHGPDRVLFQQGDERIDIGGLPSAHVAPEENTLSVVGHGRLDLAVGGKPPQSCPRALQRAVDRRDRRLENVGRLLSGPAKDVAKQQGRALARRQLLDRRDEGELDRLTCLVSRLRAWRAIADVLERGAC